METYITTGAATVDNAAKADLDRLLSKQAQGAKYGIVGDILGFIGGGIQSFNNNAGEKEAAAAAIAAAEAKAAAAEAEAEAAKKAAQPWYTKTPAIIGMAVGGAALLGLIIWLAVRSGGKKKA